MSDPQAFDVDFARGRFPALNSEWVYFDNGGGSQILQPVVDRITEYLLTSNVQHGASYGASQLAGERLRLATDAMATLIKAADPSEIIMGPSTSALLQVLANAFAGRLGPGDRVIVTTGDHEANIGPWLGLARKGVEVAFWGADPRTGELLLDDLTPLLGPRTRLVAMTHTSNILGTINPVRAVADVVHEHGALLCLDGVGYAPHRAVDVQAMDADFYAFSFYKVFGPHHALLYGKRELLLELPGQSHFFVPEDDVPYKFQPGSVNYELSYGMLGLMDYLDELSGADGVRHNRAAVENAFDAISRHEETLTVRLLDYLNAKPGVRIIGHPTADRARRVSIVSFTVEGMKSSEIVRQVDEHHIGIRFGNFYSVRLMKALGLTAEEGVVRVSMVHYNTTEEVDRLIDALDHVI